MVTILDPGGTPTPTYNRSGITIQTIDAGSTSGGTQDSGVGNDGTPIVRYSQNTIALVNGGTHNGGTWQIVTTLPNDAEVGDVVELYATTSGWGVVIFPPVGESIRSLATSTGTSSTASTALTGSSAILRKVSASNWQAVVGA